MFLILVLQPLLVLIPRVFPGYERNVGRWLGVAHKVVQYLCYWIFPYSSAPTSWSTVQPLTDYDLQTPDIGRHIVELDEVIKIKVVDGMVNGYSDPILMDIFHNYLEGLVDGGNCLYPYGMEL